MDPELRDAIEGYKPRTEDEAYADEMPTEAKWVEIPSGSRYCGPGAERRQVKSQKRMSTAKWAQERTRRDAAKRKLTSA